MQIDQEFIDVYRENIKRYNPKSTNTMPELKIGDLSLINGKMEAVADVDYRVCGSGKDKKRIACYVFYLAHPLGNKEKYTYPCHSLDYHNNNQSE
jgi:hypothetical protein